MRALPRTRLHRLIVAATALALGIIGVTSAPPTATAAPGSGSTTSSFEFDIHEHDTFDMTLTMKSDGTPPSLYCTKDLITVDDSSADVSTRVQGDQCILSMAGTSIDNSKDGKGLNINHRGSTYVFESSDLSDMKGIGATVKVTFPGKVISSDEHAQTDGNTVTWSDIDSLDSLRAEGEDSASAPTQGTAADRDKKNSRGSIEDRNSRSLFWTWVIAGGVAVVVACGVIALIVLNRRKTPSSATAPVSAHNQPQVPGQPGYTQPGLRPYGPADQQR